jgi:hypothetical protein
MVMKSLTALVAAIFLLAGIGASDAAVRIVEDGGGRIGAYVDKYRACGVRVRWWSSMVIVPRPAPSFLVRFLMTKYA